ncbi:MAG: hypothetical protein DYG89_46210 [Caldilinea sp. CFX5]|nr:hypothetical protein [Caldilinea sp. CFX5]
MALAEAIVSELKTCGVQWVTWLPDSETDTMYKLITGDPAMRLVQVCREDEAFGVCSGLLKGGAKAVVMIQNTGLMNAIDALRGIPIRLCQPMLLLVGYRGYKGMVEHAQRIDNAATFTEPLLNAFQVPYYLVHSAGDAAKIRLAYTEAQQRQGPVAVLITREFKEG